jgi:hypothetical protein
MIDQKSSLDDEKRKQTEIEQVTAAVVLIAETEAGVLFFRWLKKQCHFERSTISGNQETFEVNTIGSIAQEFQRAIYLKIRRGFDRKAKIRIEID